jgi:GH15 family glucan-1,4-alpha-glucosidase
MTTTSNIPPTPPAALTTELTASSLSVITSNQQANGAYPASPSFSAYRGYCWFRDGAFIADGVSAAGDRFPESEAKAAIDSATAFFDWCAATVERHRTTVEAIVAAAATGSPLPADRMLPARFTLDGSLGTDDWWDFQLDGYGTWLWAAAAHAERHGIDLERWRVSAELTVDYLVSSWDRPCYDWWEEHQEQVHVSTLGCVGAGLVAAIESGLISGERATGAAATVTAIRELIENRGTHNGHLVKWLDSDAVDGSLSALIAPLAFIPASSPTGKATIAAVEAQLTVDGGVHRFLADVFYGGGQWPLLSCFLGLAKAASGDVGGARSLRDWAASTATPELLLPEQVDGHLLAPDHHEEWIERWGTVATPLLWSHAMLLRLTVEVDPA